MNEEYCNMKTIGAIYGKTSHQVGRELRECGYRDEMGGLLKWHLAQGWRCCGGMQSIGNGFPSFGTRPRSVNCSKTSDGRGRWTMNNFLFSPHRHHGLRNPRS